MTIAQSVAKPVAKSVAQRVTKPGDSSGGGGPSLPDKTIRTRAGNDIIQRDGAYVISRN